jgi:glycosyltransferase involved in cell wall biosynthesis
VVTTPSVAAGLDVRPGQHLLVAADAPGLAAAALELIRDRERAHAMAVAARDVVARRYRWEDSARGVEDAWAAAVADRRR